MKKSVERVKLDEMLKNLFSASQKVLVQLLNGLFDMDYREGEVQISLGSTEFVNDPEDLGMLRADMFFDATFLKTNKVAGFHVEFQIKNDGTMIIRMLEYGLKKAKEKRFKNQNALVIPRQKVIYFEKNSNISAKLETLLIFPNGQEVMYQVDVMKYWEYSDADLIEKKLYPLLPLQLFNLRQELKAAAQRRDYPKIKALANQVREIAKKLAVEIKELFDESEFPGEDFHKMLITINNLTEYLNRVFIQDNTLEKTCGVKSSK